MKAWENYVTRDKTRRVSVKIIINGSAEYDPNATPVTDFDDLVNTIFNAHKDDLENIFKTAGDISLKSAGKDFRFDSVEKQIR